MNYEQKYNGLIKRLREYRERFGSSLYKEIGEESPEIAFLDTLPEQPVEGLEEEIKRYFQPIQAWEVQEAPFTSLEKCARHFAEWGASHAVAPHYFKLRELKTGRVFLAEWSDMAGEWYERGNGRAHQSDEVEIVQHAKKK